MNTVKIEVNGLDINDLANKIENLTNALTSKANHEATPTASEEKLLTRIQTAKLLGVTLPTLYDWTKKGLLTSYRIGNRIRYKHAEIMEAITKNKTH